MKGLSVTSQLPQVFGRFMFYQRSQHWSRQRIEDYQNAKVIEIVRYAGKYVPYYRKLFREIGLDVESFRGLEDIEKIPLLDKEQLRTRADEFIADGATQKRHEWVKTSGSTGTPLKILVGEQGRANKTAVMVRAMWWAGYRPFSKRLVIKGMSAARSTNYGFDRWQNTVYLNASRMSAERCLKVGELIAKHKPTFFEGQVRLFVDFYNVLAEHGMKIPQPKSIFCYGETITPQIRQFIESKYNAPLFDHYGMVELSGGIDQLPDGKQYLTEDYFYPEILSAEGKIESHGYGELISTGFYNKAMPLIRYKTRDFVRVLPHNERGRYAFREVEAIEGRMDDYLLLPDGRKIYFASTVFGVAKGIVAAQYVQDDVHRIQINLVVDSEFSKDSFNDIEAQLRKIKSVEEDVKIEFAIVKALEKNKSGKTPLIISKLKNVASY